jgi:large subunit ribosomal protein L6
MKHIIKKNIINIPNSINIIYLINKKTLILVNSIFQKSLKLKVQIFFNKSKRIVKVSNFFFNKSSVNKKKCLNSFQGTQVALIKQNILELSINFFYQKLKLFGVGYRAFDVSRFYNSILMFKLGYSHFIYFKITKNIKMFNLKGTKFFFFSQNYQDLRKFTSLIHCIKTPEPYKGKGFLYENEKIKLRKAKKI